MINPIDSPLSKTVLLSVRESCYSPYYCEENIWQLAYQLKDHGRFLAKDLTIWMMTTPERYLPMRFQSQNNPNGWIFWDYHVVLLANRIKQSPLIFDLGTALPFPVNASEYIEASFPDFSLFPDDFSIWIRSIPADHYLQSFSSDRSHMLGEGVPEPQWPKITADQSAMSVSLQHYWDCSVIIGKAPWFELRTNTDWLGLLDSSPDSFK